MADATANMKIPLLDIRGLVEWENAKAYSHPSDCCES